MVTSSLMGYNPCDIWGFGITFPKNTDWKMENQNKMMKVDQLIFDPLNPRLPTSKEGASETEVLEYMILNEKVTDLMLSISEQGYFDGEPLLVVESKQHKGSYEVVEGNRRLAALKLLNDPSKAPRKEELIKEIVNAANQRPEQVPVIIYGSRKDILMYLGYRHITGVEAWNSLAKAKYLHQLYQNENPNHDGNRNADGRQKDQEKARLQHIAKLIGSRADYVKRLLVGYKVFKTIEDQSFFGIKDVSEENFSFSLLTTALSYSELGDFVNVGDGFNLEGEQEINLDHLGELTKWIFEKEQGKTRLGESRNLKTLNAVVSNDKALKAFRGGKSLLEASYLSDEPREIFFKAIQDSYNRLKDARDNAHLVEKIDDITLGDIREIFLVARDLHKIMLGKMTDNETLE